eukprot:484184_1
MSSRFPFSRHVRDIENSNKSPHSNCSTHSTPSKKTPHSTSVSPHTSTPNKSITIAHYKPPSALKILLPQHPGIASRDSYPIQPENNNSHNNNNNNKNKTHLTVPTNHSHRPSDSDHFSSSPILLTLNTGNRSSIPNKSSNHSNKSSDKSGN